MYTEDPKWDDLTKYGYAFPPIISSRLDSNETVLGFMFQMTAALCIAKFDEYSHPQLLLRSTVPRQAPAFPNRSVI